MGRYRLPYTLYKRGKYWYYRAYNSDGSRGTPKSTGKKLKKEAQEYCDNLLVTGDLNSSEITFYNYAADFFSEGSLYLTDRAVPLTEGTIRGHRSRLKVHIMPYFQHYKLKDISPYILKQYRAELLNNGISQGSIMLISATLQAIISTAYKMELISRNPFEKLDSIKLKSGNKEAFTLEEVKLLYDSATDKYKPLVLLLALTGMRISEALGVTIDDIQKTDRLSYIHLTRQKDLKNNYAPLKTKDERDIPVIDELISCTGFDVGYCGVHDVFKRLIDSKLDKERKLSLHSFRHFFITNAKAENVNPIKVEVIAGHSLTKIVDTYTNFNAEDLADILDWQKKTYEYITG